MRKETEAMTKHIVISDITHCGLCPFFMPDLGFCVLNNKKKSAHDVSCKKKGV